MKSNVISTLVEMFSSNPIESSIVTLVPIVIVAVQLLNSLFNGLSVAVSGSFAIVVLAFSVLLVRYQLVQFRLTKLQNETIAYPAD